jgi:hypothetical protein
MSVCCECCALSSRGLCDGQITRPEESYRMWRVVCVISKNLVSEVIARDWAAAPSEKKKNYMMIHLCWDMMWFQTFRRNVMSASSGVKQFKNIICFDSFILVDYSTAFSPKLWGTSPQRHGVTS